MFEGQVAVIKKTQQSANISPYLSALCIKWVK